VRDEAHLPHNVADHSLLAVPAAEFVTQLRPPGVAHQNLDNRLLLFIDCKASHDF
jgi:hypothetical protein